MKNQLAVTQMLNVQISPLNEGQELNYSEPFKGTIQQIVTRCREIETGLQSLLKRGSFSVQITNWSLQPNGEKWADFVYQQGDIFDAENNIIFSHGKFA